MTCQMIEYLGNRFGAKSNGQVKTEMVSSTGGMTQTSAVKLAMDKASLKSYKLSVKSKLGANSPENSRLNCLVYSTQRA